MALQTTVNLYQSGAVAGDKAGQNPVVYTPDNLIAGATVNVGSFVWRDSTNTNQAKNTGSGTPLGYVQRNLANYNYTVSSDGSLTIPQYGAVTVARKGDFYAKADATVAIGATVYANTSTGAVTFTSGSSTVSTGFVAMTAGSTNDLVVISNW